MRICGSGQATFEGERRDKGNVVAIDCLDDFERQAIGPLPAVANRDAGRAGRGLAVVWGIDHGDNVFGCDPVEPATAVGGVGPVDHGKDLEQRRPLP